MRPIVGGVCLVRLERSHRLVTKGKSGLYRCPSYSQSAALDCVLRTRLYPETARRRAADQLRNICMLNWARHDGEGHSRRPASRTPHWWRGRAVGITPYRDGGGDDRDTRGRSPASERSHGRREPARKGSAGSQRSFRAQPLGDGRAGRVAAALVRHPTRCPASTGVEHGTHAASHEPGTRLPLKNQGGAAC